MPFRSENAGSYPRLANGRGKDSPWLSLGEASRKKNEGPFFKTLKTSADCTLVQARPRELPINGTVKANPVESIDNKKTRGESEKSTKDILDG